MSASESKRWIDIIKQQVAAEGGSVAVWAHMDSQAGYAVAPDGLTVAPLGEYGIAPDDGARPLAEVELTDLKNIAVHLTPWTAWEEESGDFLSWNQRQLLEGDIPTFGPGSSAILGYSGATPASLYTQEIELTQTVAWRDGDDYVYELRAGEALSAYHSDGYYCVKDPSGLPDFELRIPAACASPAPALAPAPSKPHASKAKM